LEAAVSAGDDGQDDESSSELNWQTIATHGRAVAEEARSIAEKLAPELGHLIHLAGRWHDVGKSHAAFQGSIRGEHRPDRTDLAKAPKSAWPRRHLYELPDGSRRRGFRHELASTLALFAVLRRHQPEHAALVGRWRELLDEAGMSPDLTPASSAPAICIETEILALDPAAFDLLCYLVCAHHGKVRMTWHACPADQNSRDDRLRIRGIRDGDRLPRVLLSDREAGTHALPETALDLSPSAVGLNPRTGAGWTERTLGLLSRYGPFGLAWLEALLRAADMRASRALSVDVLLADQEAPCR
jgi:CRISPR-associated endonuclease/helicase Cas3